MPEPTIKELMRKAFALRIVIPGFNIPYLPMIEPVVDAIRDCGSFGLVMVARPDLVQFEAGSYARVREEYEKFKDMKHTRLHVDHVPVIDENQQRVDFMKDLEDALKLGFDSVMVDGSRLSLEDNIACTRRVVELAAKYGEVPVESELGSVMGHESGPMMSYEELFATGKGFTDPAEAARFVKESGTSWLSVAVGSIHGAITGARASEKKVAARLNIPHLKKLEEATGVPLVLHGGSGIQKQFILDGIKAGISKINVGTNLRQAYEAGLKKSLAAAKQAVYDTTVSSIRDDLEATGSAKLLL